MQIDLPDYVHYKRGEKPKIDQAIDELNKITVPYGGGIGFLDENGVRVDIPTNHAILFVSETAPTYIMNKAKAAALNILNESRKIENIDSTEKAEIEVTLRAVKLLQNTIRNLLITIDYCDENSILIVGDKLRQILDDIVAEIEPGRPEFRQENSIRKLNDTFNKAQKYAYGHTRGPNLEYKHSTLEKQKGYWDSSNLNPEDREYINNLLLKLIHIENAIENFLIVIRHCDEEGIHLTERKKFDKINAEGAPAGPGSEFDKLLKLFQQAKVEAHMLIHPKRKTELQKKIITEANK